MKSLDIVINLPKAFTAKSSHDKDFETQSLKELVIDKLFIKFSGINGFMRCHKLLNDLTSLCIKANKSIMELANEVKSQENTNKIEKTSLEETPVEEVVKSTVMALMKIGGFDTAIELIRELFSEGYVYITETEKMIGLQIKMFDEAYSFDETTQIYKNMLAELLKKSGFVSQNEND